MIFRIPWCTLWSALRADWVVGYVESHLTISKGRFPFFLSFLFLSFFLSFFLFLVPREWLGRCAHRLSMSWGWPFAVILWCPRHPGLQYQLNNPETGLRQWLLTDDLGTFSHSVEDGIISHFFFFSFTFHDYDSSILTSWIFSLLVPRSAQF